MNQPGGIIEWIFDAIYKRSYLYRQHCEMIKSLEKSIEEYRFYLSDSEKQPFET